MNQPQKPQVIRRTFEKGKMLFHEGDKGDYAYLIQTGSIKIVKHTESGMVTLATVTTNGIVGEMALLDRRPRMASAIAAEETTCIFINAEQLEQKLATLTAVERNDFKVMMEFVRVALPWEQRLKNSDLAKPSESDKVIVGHMKAHAHLLPSTQDRFLLSLYDILRNYVKRRLPPGVI